MSRKKIEKPSIRRKDCQEVLTLFYRDKQVAQVTRQVGGGLLNIYLGRDEPQEIRCVCWEDAKDYVFRWLREGMPEPTEFR